MRSMEVGCVEHLSVFTVNSEFTQKDGEVSEKLWQAKSREQDAKQKQMEADALRVAR